VRRLESIDASSRGVNYAVVTWFQFFISREAAHDADELFPEEAKNYDACYGAQRDGLNHAHILLDDYTGG